MLYKLNYIKLIYKKFGKHVFMLGQFRWIRFVKICREIEEYFLPVYLYVYFVFKSIKCTSLLVFGVCFVLYFFCIFWICSSTNVALTLGYSLCVFWNGSRVAPGALFYYAPNRVTQYTCSLYVYFYIEDDYYYIWSYATISILYFLFHFFLLHDVGYCIIKIVEIVWPD